MVTTEFIITIPDLKSAGSPECDEAVNKAVATLDAVVGGTLAQLRQKDLPNEGKVYAIYLLGELRAVRAVTDLLDLIDLKAPKVDPALRDARWGQYPAQEALTKIGKPAIYMVLQKLSTEADPLRRKLMCSVIIDVEGKEFGHILLDRELGKQTDPGKRANLEAALKLLDG